MFDIEAMILPWLDTFAAWGWLVVLLTAIAAGELGVTTMAIISAQDYLSVWTVFGFGVLGMLITDSAWFFIAKTKLLRRMQEQTYFQKVSAHVNALSGGRDVAILLISKILVGTRILLILYVSSRKMSFAKFFTYNLGPTILWGALITILGYLAGKGYQGVLVLYDDYRLAISFIVALAVVVYVLQIQIRKKVLAIKIKKNER